MPVRVYGRLYETLLFKIEGFFSTASSPLIPKKTTTGERSCPRERFSNGVFMPSISGYWKDRSHPACKKLAPFEILSVCQGRRIPPKWGVEGSFNIKGHCGFPQRNGWWSFVALRKCKVGKGERDWETGRLGDSETRISQLVTPKVLDSRAQYSSAPCRAAHAGNVCNTLANPNAGCTTRT